MVDGLTGDDAGAAELLRIDHHVAALGDLARQYALALDRQIRVTPQALKSAWQAVHHRVLDLAFAIVIHVDDVDQRALILSPIFEQDDRLAAVYAARQRGQVVTDLDLDVDAAAEGDDDLDILDGADEGFDPLDIAPAADPVDGDAVDADANADAADADAAPVGDAPLRGPLPRPED